MRRDQNIESASAWLGATIFSLLTGAAFGYGAFLLLIDNAWQGMSFIIVAIAFARLCWVALPKDHKLQLWVTGCTIALAFAFLLYLISSMTLRFM
jgi:hypothetical protein